MQITKTMFPYEMKLCPMHSCIVRRTASSLLPFSFVRVYWYTWLRMTWSMMLVHALEQRLTMVLTKHTFFNIITIIILIKVGFVLLVSSVMVSIN